MALDISLIAINDFEANLQTLVINMITFIQGGTFII